MNRSLRALPAVIAVFLSTQTAVADSSPGDARAGAAVDAAHITARKIRKQWDQLREKDQTAASCLEDKVARALTLGSRIQLRRIELRDAEGEKARGAALSAIEALDAQRIELEDEARVCVHGKSLATVASGTKLTVKINPRLPGDSSERELQLLLMSMPMLGR